MVLRAGTQCLTRIATRKATLGWGGAITVGLAAVSWRSISSHVACGDIRRSSINSRFLRSFFSASSFTANTMTLTPPQAPPLWSHSADDITKLTKESIETYRKVMDKVGALEPKDATFESVRLHLIDIFHTNLSYSLFPGICACPRRRTLSQPSITHLDRLHSREQTQHSKQ